MIYTDKANALDNMAPRDKIKENKRMISQMQGRIYILRWNPLG